MAALLFREDFEDRAGALEAPLGGLIGIGGRADGDAVGPIELAQLAAQDFRSGGFGIDLGLEVARILHAHELVGVARVTVVAAELAAAVGVDGPLERHIGLGAIEDAARADLEVLDRGARWALGFQQFALGGHFSDANQLRHSSMFAISSPLRKAVSSGAAVAGREGAPDGAAGACATE